MNRRHFLAGLAGTLALPRIARAADEPLRIRALYDKGFVFSSAAEALNGDRVTFRGFMAPPLKADSTFFVLTARPMAVCPFCESEAQWPDDILAVYAKRVVDVIPFNVEIVARGRLELGTYEDPETGFVSRVRILDATFERV
ncbi:hypothetical protein AB7M35_000563 [Amorphus suaedae]